MSLRVLAQKIYNDSLSDKLLHYSPGCLPRRVVDAEFYHSAVVLELPAARKIASTLMIDADDVAEHTKYRIHASDSFTYEQNYGGGYELYSIFEYREAARYSKPGLTNEELSALKAYEKELCDASHSFATIYESGPIINKFQPWLIATPDRIIFDVMATDKEEKVRPLKVVSLSMLKTTTLKDAASSRKLISYVGKTASTCSTKSILYTWKYNSSSLYALAKQPPW